MPGVMAAWDLALKLITEFAGKHHSNISFVISQNISKVLSDTVRLNNKRVQDITNKVDCVRFISSFFITSGVQGNEVLLKRM